jgi:hypothetical protein
MSLPRRLIASSQILTPMFNLSYDVASPQGEAISLGIRGLLVSSDLSLLQKKDPIVRLGLKEGGLE